MSRVAAGVEHDGDVVGMGGGGVVLWRIWGGVRRCLYSWLLWLVSLTKLVRDVKDYLHFMSRTRIGRLCVDRMDAAPICRYVSSAVGDCLHR